jgi:hypothetical protein
VSWLRWLKTYSAHEDELAATGNTIALVLAGNGPFYPLYGFILIGWAAWPTLSTMLSAPLFAAVPWLMRRNTKLGRVALSLLGTLNTLWCVKLLGLDTGVDLFLLPCATLAAMLFYRNERWVMLPLLGLPIAAFIGLKPFYGPALLPLPAQAAAHMVALNAGSVAMLTGFFGLVFSRRI